MEFVMEKCVILVIKSAKRHLANGMELMNKEMIRMLGEKETYKY